MFCQLCLVVDVRIFPMDTATLQIYSMFLEVPLQNTAPNICYECSALLRKYHAFKMKCIRAHNLLVYLETQQSGLVSQDGYTAQRKMYNLQSKLSLTAVHHVDVAMQDDTSDKVGNTIYIMETKVELEADAKGESMEMYDIKPDCPDIEYIHDDYDGTRECIVNELTDTSITNFDDDVLIQNNKNVNERFKKATQIANNIKSNKDIDVKARRKKEFADTSVVSVNKGAVENDENFNKLMKRATKIANNMKAKKDIDGKEKEKKFPDKYGRPVNRKTVVNKKDIRKLRKVAPRRSKTENKRILDQESLKGFATVVPLSPEAARNEILLRKKTSNYLNSAYKCELCYRGFKTETTFDYHMKKHSQEFGPLECEYCHYRLPNKRRLTAHIGKIHKLKYICDMCDYVCFARSQARAHVKRHKGELFKCSECDATFRHSNTLAGHKRREHARDCVCELCGNAFISQYALQCHKNLRHRQESPALSGPRCAECALQFATQAAYERHLVMSDKHRNADESNGCGICGKIFSNKRLLKSHIVHQHTQTELVHKCSCCGEVFYSRSAYNRHMKSQHPMEAVKANKKRTAKGQSKARTKIEKHMCELCGICVGKIAMRYHLMTHTGERPYKCEECGKAYMSPTSLYIHKENHVAIRAYQCDECPKNFKRKAAFTKHLKTHTYHPYKCDICDKRFVFPCEVKTHIKHAHDKVPWPAKKPKLAAGQETE